MANPYITPTEMMQRLDAVNTSWTAAERAALEGAIEAVSRKVDEVTSQHFYRMTATLEFTPTSAGVLVLPHPLVSVTTLKHSVDTARTYDQTWATTDYDLWPYNASNFGKPYTELRVTPAGTQSFPVGATKSVELAAVWGWPTVPEPIKQAVALEASRMMQMGQNPSGVVAASSAAGFTAVRIAPQLHPTAMALIRPYMVDLMAGTF